MTKQFPNKQKFNSFVKKNQTKKNAWWQIGKSNNPQGIIIKQCKP